MKRAGRTNLPEIQLEPYNKSRNQLCIAGRLILKENKIVIPKELHQRILQIVHENHMGIVKTKQTLRTKVWWPTLNQDVEEMVTTCIPCQLVTEGCKFQPLKPTKLPDGPWQSLYADILGHFPSGEYILAIIDGYSRYPEIKIIKKTYSIRIIQEMEEIFARHTWISKNFKD